MRIFKLCPFIRPFDGLILLDHLMVSSLIKINVKSRDVWEAQITLQSILSAWRGKYHSAAPGLWFLSHSGLAYPIVIQITFYFQGRSSCSKHQIVPGQAALKIAL